MTEPLALTPVAALAAGLSPGRMPKSTMPPPAVQRKVCEPEAELLVPTTTEPSPLTAFARLSNTPPGRSPNGVRLAAAEAVETALPNSTAAQAPAAKRSVRIERCDWVMVSAPFAPVLGGNGWAAPVEPEAETAGRCAAMATAHTYRRYAVIIG